jgi:predicted nucleic acid-binding Zn ribbon protein
MKKYRGGDAQSVGQAIRDLLNSYQLSTKFDEANLIQSWERIVGKPIAKRTRKLFIKNKVLFVEFDSPTMRHDFSLHKAQVLEMFRKEFGEGVIMEIIAM